MALFSEGILKLHWDQSVPVNLARIAKGMGLAMTLSDQLDAAALLEISAQNKPRLTLNTRQNAVRQRYTVAHAMGHLALHHLRPGTQRDIVLSDNFALDPDSRIDTEANHFALGLLMPEQVVTYCLNDLALADLNALADMFEVAPQLVKQRLADLNLRLPSKPRRDDRGDRQTIDVG